MFGGLDCHSLDAKEQVGWLTQMDVR
jgi:hypothetical protein